MPQTHFDADNEVTIRRYHERKRRPVPPPEPAEPPAPFIRHEMSSEATYLIDQSADTERKFIARRKLAEPPPPPVPEPPPFEPMLSEAQQRQRLSGAIEACSKAQTAFTLAAELVERSQQRLAMLGDKVRSFGNLDQDITAHYVHQVRADNTDALPPSLAAAMAERGSLTDELDATQRAHAVLVAELESADNRLKLTLAERTHAAAYVVANHADMLAIQLNSLLDECDELRRTIVSIGSIWLSTSLGASAMPLTSRARTALNRQLVEVHPVPSLVSVLRDYMKKLEGNAAAELAEA